MLCARSSLSCNITVLMVLIIDGNSAIGAHVRSNFCYLICLRHALTQRAVKNRFFFSSIRAIFLHPCATYPELPTNTSTMLHPTEMLNQLYWLYFYFYLHIYTFLIDKCCANVCPRSLVHLYLASKDRDFLDKTFLTILS